MSQQRNVCKNLPLVDGFHVVALLMVFASSIVAMIPFWIRIYTPIFMYYHYYPAAMAIGLYSCHRFSPNNIAASVVTILGSFIAIVWWSIWLNEYNLAGPDIVFGERNYSHIIGSNQSLQVTTSKSVEGSDTYMSMSTLDIMILTFLALTSLAICIITILHVTKNTCHADRKGSWISDCPSLCEKETHKKTQLHGRLAIYIFSAFGVAFFIYYLVASLILVLDSVVLINPVASPNPIYIYVSFASIGIPDIHRALLDKNQQPLRNPDGSIRRVRDLPIKMAFIYLLLFFWFWSLVISIVALSQLAIWRMDQDPYLSTTNGFCPVQAINDTLTFSEYEWGNFSFSGFAGVDEMTLHNNTLNWTPELFATYSCADDSLMLSQIFLSLGGMLAVVQYLNQPRPDATKGYQRINSQQFAQGPPQL